MNCPPSPYTYSFFPCSCPERISQYVSEHTAWADKIYRRFVNLRTDYQKPEHRKKPGQLTARQLWKLKHLSYLKPYYKQCHKSRKHYQGTGAVGGAAITSMEQESDDDHKPEHEERGYESSSRCDCSKCINHTITCKLPANYHQCLPFDIAIHWACLDIGHQAMYYYHHHCRYYHCCCHHHYIIIIIIIIIVITIITIIIVIIITRVIIITVIIIFLFFFFF